MLLGGDDIDPAVLDEIIHDADFYNDGTGVITLEEFHRAIDGWEVM